MRDPYIEAQEVLEEDLDLVGPHRVDLQAGVVEHTDGSGPASGVFAEHAA